MMNFFETLNCASIAYSEGATTKINCPLSLTLSLQEACAVKSIIDYSCYISFTVCPPRLAFVLGRSHSQSEKRPFGHFCIEIYYFFTHPCKPLVSLPFTDMAASALCSKAMSKAKSLISVAKTLSRSVSKMVSTVTKTFWLPVANAIIEHRFSWGWVYFVHDSLFSFIILSV